MLTLSLFLCFAISPIFAPGPGRVACARARARAHTHKWDSLNSNSPSPVSTPPWCPAAAAGRRARRPCRARGPTGATTAGALRPTAVGERRGRPNKAAAPRQAPPPAPSPPCRRSGPWRARRRDVHSARSEPLQAVAGSSQVSYRRAGREQLFAGLSPHCRARPSRRSVRSSSAAGRSPGSRRRAGGGRGADRGLGGCCPQAAIAPPRPAATAAA